MGIGIKKNCAFLSKMTTWENSTDPKVSKYQINIAMNPHSTTRRLLVRPEDKVAPQQMFEGVCSIAGKSCNKST